MLPVFYYSLYHFIITDTQHTGKRRENSSGNTWSFALSLSEQDNIKKKKKRIEQNTNQLKPKPNK